MKDFAYTVKELMEWYNKNTNVSLSEAFLGHLIDKGVLLPIENGKYSLRALNDLLIEKYNNEYVIKDNKYSIKENRKELISKFKDEKKKMNKFKLTTLNGNKMKLIQIR